MTLGPRRLPALTTAAVASLLALTLTGCSEDYEPEPGPEPGSVTRGIDAAAYAEDYEEGESDSAGGGTNYSASAPESSDSEGRAVPEPGLLEDNTFVDAGTGGFVDPREDAESTFALDVDTGSYGVARTLLADGVAPPPESIRVEEWVNAVPSDAAAPGAGQGDLAVSADAMTEPGRDDGTQLVRVAVAAREVSQEQRPRVNVTLVVDTSGSMDIRSRLGLVRSSLALLADRLRDDDTVSVVTFEDTARPVLEPTPVSDTETILDAVEELTPGGSTNLEAGLAMGYEQARDAFDDDAVNLVVLCSDGVANVGSTGPGSISERIAEEGRDGINLVTVGYGMGNYNDHLMEQLADLGDGFYAYVDTFGEAERLFGDDLTTTLTPVAAEARSQVTFDPARVTAYRLIGYENRALADEDFEDLGVDAGELGAGHRSTALYEVRLADGVEPGARIGEAAVRWAADGEPAQAAIPLLAADPTATPPPALELQSVVADLAQALEQASPYAGEGVGLDELAQRAGVLEEAGVDGAEEVATLVEQARRATSHR